MNGALSAGTQYQAVITREQFLFFEMRTTAQLLNQGLSDDEAVRRIVQDNLFQFPTEKSLKSMANACLRRLHVLDDDALIAAVATQTQTVAKQVCLYAMMKQQRLVRDFMLNVIGEKYRRQDMLLRRMDVNAFFMTLQEQDDAVASWSTSTITRLGQVLMRILVENEYIDNVKSEQLNRVLLCGLLEDAMREHGDVYMFPAFNRFE